MVMCLANDVCCAMEAPAMRTIGTDAATRWTDCLAMIVCACRQARVRTAAVGQRMALDV